MRSCPPVLFLLTVLATGSVAAEDTSSNGNSGSILPSSGIADPKSGQATGTSIGGPDTDRNSKAEDGKSDTVKADTSKADTSKADSGKADTSKTGSAAGSNHESGRSNNEDKQGLHGLSTKDATTSKVDTSITVNQGGVADNGDARHHRPKDGESRLAAGRTAKNGLPQASTLGGPRRNAVRTAIVSGKAARQEPPRGATGLPTTPPAAASDSTKAPAAVPAVTTASPHNNTSLVPAAPPASGQPGHAAIPTAAGPTPSNPSALSGATMLKPAAHSAMIAGAPKLLAGVISGNTVHAKHP